MLIIRFFTLLLTVLIFPTCNIFSRDVKLDLRSAVVLGLNRNLDLIKQKTELKLKKSGLYDPLQSFIPKLSVSFNQAYDIKKHADDVRQNKLQFSLQQTLYDGGKVRNTVKFSKAEVKLAQKQYDLQKQNLTIKIITAFAQALTAKNKVKLYHEFIKISKKELTLAELEVNLGRMTTLDQQEIATKYKNTEIELLQSKQALNNAHYSIKQLLRISDNIKIQVIGDLPEKIQIKTNTPSLHQLFHTAKRNRLEFKSVHLKFQQALYQYKLMKLNWLPDISVSADYFLSGPSLDFNQRGYNFYFNISFPFFGSPASINNSFSDESSGRTYKISPLQDYTYFRKMNQAKIKAQLAKIDQNELPEKIKREIGNSLKALKLLQKKISLRKLQIKMLVQRIALLELKVKLGEAKRLDLAKARIEYYQAKLGISDDILNYISTSYNLELQTGAKPGQLKLFKLESFNI